MARSGGTTTASLDLASQAIVSAWSISIRAKFNSGPTAGLSFLWQHGDSGIDYNTGFTHDHPTAAFRDAFFWGNTAGTYYTAQISPGTATWRVITCTFDGSNIRCYLDTSAPVTTAVSGSQGTGNRDMAVFNATPSDGTSDYPISGDAAFFARWDAVLTDAECVSLGKGYHPLAIRPASLANSTDIGGNLSPEPDLINGTSWTVNGTLAKASNPPIILPRRRFVVPAATSPPPPPSNTNYLMPLVGVGD